MTNTPLENEKPDTDTSSEIDSLISFIGSPQASTLGDLASKEQITSDLNVAALNVTPKRKLSGKQELALANEDTEDLSIKAFHSLYDEVAKGIKSFSREEKEFLLGFIQGKVTEYARLNFYTYVKHMAQLILPEGFIDGRHIKLMADELQKIERATMSGRRERIQIFCPPGAMKSKLINLFISWVLGRHPKWNILHIGHGTQFVEDNSGRPIRDLLMTAEYRQIFPDVHLKQDSRAAGRWELTTGGRYYGAGVNTRIAGRRAHISLCDDVVSEQTAYSIVERKGINAWYVPGLRSRLLPNGSEVIVNTRWHTEDLSGFLLESDKRSKRPWKVIKIPAILDEPASKLLGLPVGASFWPEFQPLEFLLERKADQGLLPSQWSALYMQEPIPEEGALLKESDFQMWTKDEPPPVDSIILSLDTAYSLKTRSSFSAYSIWGVFQERRVDTKGRDHWIPNLILIECAMKRWEYPELVKQVKEIQEWYKPDMIVIENKASGQSLIPELRLMGLPVVEFDPNKYGDKVMRVHACTPYFRNKRIWVPQNQTFTNDIIKQSLEFPFGAYDDLVDTMSQAIITMRDTLNLSAPTHISEEDDDEDFHKPKHRTYWSASHRS